MCWSCSTCCRTRSSPCSPARRTSVSPGKPTRSSRSSHRSSTRLEKSRLDGGVGLSMTSGHTITITPVSRHVEVALAGTKLAESDEVVVLEETGLPPRYYLSRGDVRTELLVPSDSTTTCPFKGDASYWSVELDGRAYA